MSNLLSFIAFLAAPLLAGAIGGYMTTPSIPTWYVDLAKPALTPPNWIFGPVWTTLYILMGIASYLVYKKGKGKKKKLVKKALYFYSAQLVVNIFWSVTFFGMRNPWAGFVVIFVLWILIAMTTMKFWKIDKRAGMLMIPYILWVSFASYLNLSIALLN